MGWKAALITLGLAATATAVPAPASHVVHEEKHSHSQRWAKVGRVPSHVKLPVRIGLAQNNLENAEEYLMDVSHPHSPNYGKHWTPEEVIEAFKPNDETVDEVRSWLVQSGIDEKSITHSDNKAWFAFFASTEQMESLLHTEYHEYEDLHTGGVMPACDRYHIPAHIQKHIDYITPGIKLIAPAEKPKPHQKRQYSKRQSPHEGSWPSGSHHGGFPGGRPPFGHPGAPWKSHRPQHPMPHNPQTNLSTCDIAITPACIAALYKIPEPGHLADPRNSLGIFEAELQYWDQIDLDLFFKNFTHWIPEGTHPIDKLVDGGVAIAPNLSAAGGESMLDLDMAYPIVAPQTITIWNVDDIHYQTWANDTYTWGFNTLLDAIDGSYCKYCAYGECGDAPGIDPTYPDPGPDGYKGPVQCGVFRPTNVYSLSYGGQEAEVPIAYQKRQCNEFLKLGLQGISFLFASGDSGVGDYPPPFGTGCLGPDMKIFSPTWPNNCPYVTNVGATKVYPGSTVFDSHPESAVFDPAGHPYAVNFSSGGGFSNVYGIPSYQKQHVAAYFAEHDPPYAHYSALAPNAPNPAKLNAAELAGNTGGVYNRIGRGIPDVAAVGDNGAVYVNGTFGLSGGTSMSTPIFAAVINRINDERLAAGKKPVGFINPVLYTHPEVLNDIINGSNPDCGSQGFTAVKGWDPVTGLGTPNYPKMLELFMSLP